MVLHAWRRGEGGSGHALMRMQTCSQTVIVRLARWPVMHHNPTQASLQRTNAVPIYCTDHLKGQSLITEGVRAGNSQFPLQANPAVFSVLCNCCLKGLASTAQHSTAQHSTAQHSTAQHSTAQHSTAQHSTAQHSAAQRSTAQHSAAQHSAGC